MPRNARIPVIGIVGGIGAGKSAVAAALGELGAHVQDADREVADLLNSPDVQRTITTALGPGLLRDGTIDRPRLAALIFTDAAARSRLEHILHPLVIARAEQLIANPPQGATVLALDAPLLLEAGMDRLCDEIWFVETPWSLRLERVRANRGWDDRELRRREDAQLPVEEKRRRAHRLFTNLGSPEDLHASVADALKDLLAPQDPCG